MRIFNIDENGLLLGEGIADADPLDKGKFLIPAHAVTEAPPAVPAGKRAKWGGAAWALEDIPPPPPPPPVPTAAEIRKAEILGRLSAIDLESIRALRAKSVGKGKSADDTKLQALDAEVDALRVELAGLGV